MPDVIHGGFEWDATKARRNLKDHAIGFSEAVTVFEDPLVVIERSPKHSLGEDRYVIIGVSDQGRLLAVAYTPRHRLRIISARKLTPKERRDYEKQTE